MKIPYTNITNKIQHIGSVTLFPGQCREIEERYLPKNPAPESILAPDSTIQTLLKSSVGDVVSALPNLSAEHLDEVEAGESGKEKPRSTLMKAIAEERLRRAAADPETGQKTDLGDMEQFALDVVNLSGEEMAELAELYDVEPEYEAASNIIKAEQERRQAG
jgi:hypothetical protein